MKWKTWFFICLAILLVAEMCYFASSIFSIKKDINDIQNTIQCMTTDQPASNEHYADHYIALSEKADAEMDRLVSVVGLIATVYTIFGALIVFKAPHEIEKKIGELEKLGTQAKDDAEEAKNAAEKAKKDAEQAIKDAEQAIKNFEGKEYQWKIDDITNDSATNDDKLRKFSKLIDRYPEKAKTYIQRGDIRYKMDKYGEAISDYKMGLKYGWDEEECYQRIIEAFEKQGNQEDASRYYEKIVQLYREKVQSYGKEVLFYTEKIKSDPKNAANYNRRGCLLADIAYFELKMGKAKLCDYTMGDYDFGESKYGELVKNRYRSAINDFSEAIKLDDENTDYYQDRANAYFDLRQMEADTELDEKIMEDYKKIYELDPKNEDAYKAWQHGERGLEYVSQL